MTVVRVRPVQARNATRKTQNSPASRVFAGDAGMYRRVRALVAAVVTVTLAVGAHVAGHGMVPPLAVVLPVIVAVWFVSNRLSERKIHPWQLLTLLGGAQAAIHTLASIMEMSHGHETGVIDPFVMTLWHVASTIVTAGVLSYADRVWWHLHSWLRRQLPPENRPIPLDLYRLAPIASPAAIFYRRLDAGSVRMRAPPLGFRYEPARQRLLGAV